MLKMRTAVAQLGCDIVSVVEHAYVILAPAPCPCLAIHRLPQFPSSRFQQNIRINQGGLRINNPDKRDDIQFNAQYCHIFNAK